MEKRKPLSVFGGILAFIGVTGRRDDFIATVETIDMLSLPGWADWSLVGVGSALLIYGFWPRSEAVRAMDREWSEEGAIKALELRLKHHRELFPRYLSGLAAVLVLVFLLVALTTCERPTHQNASYSERKLYLECLKENQGSAEACGPILHVEEANETTDE